MFPVRLQPFSRSEDCRIQVHGQGAYSVPTGQNADLNEEGIALVKRSGFYISAGNPSRLRCRIQELFPPLEKGREAWLSEVQEQEKPPSDL